MSKLWYYKPAEEWEEALPLGNGRLGAMVYGNAVNENIQVNEETMWYGCEKNRINPDAARALPKIREYIFSGNIPKAEELMRYALSGTPESMHPYQTLGNILFSFKGIDNISGYYRELDLETGIYKQSFKSKDTLFTRQMFISKPSDCLIMNFKADGEKKLNFDVILRRERFFKGVKKAGNNGIYLYGRLGDGGVEYGMTLKGVANDGALYVIGEHLIVQDSSEVTLFFTANTSYRIKDIDIYDANENIIRDASNKMYSYLVKEHMDDYQALYKRVSFDLGDLTEEDDCPTDERILKAGGKKGPDIGLFKLYFDYGRYLLISSSREGTLPATLQGIWNKEFLPPWDSKYTVNINAEMNYWPAESCNLSELHMPLLEFIKDMVPSGEKTARLMYDCRGFVCHHNTDIFKDTAPQDIYTPGSYWVMGAAWLCTHIWTHYEYTLDENFLREYFPVMRKAAEFFLDFLVEHDGYLVTCPSVSPENTFILKDGTEGANIYGVTMDNQILRDLFTECIQAAEILKIDDEMNNDIKEACSKLIPTQIGINGNILEWPFDFGEKEPGHRHISHLYGLYPSDQISIDKTPELAQAASVTLEKRLSNGGGHTGWSKAWIINHYAKLWDSENAYKNLKELIGNSTYLNMFDKHPPFQIDGNFGGTAAIAQMIVQSYSDRIILLPALPKAWKVGSMSGLKLKGGGEIYIEWKNGKLVNATICFINDRKMTLRCYDQTIEVDFKADKAKTFKVTLFGKLKELKNDDYDEE